MTSESRRRLWLALVLVAIVLAFAGTIATQTEWRDTEIPRALSGKAAEDDYYVLGRVLEKLGAHLEERDTLESMPPRDTTLVIESWIWNAFPEQDANLRAWVEGGGHLIAGSWAISWPEAMRKKMPNLSAANTWIGVQYQTQTQTRKAAPVPKKRATSKPNPDENGDSLVPKPFCTPVGEPQYGPWYYQDHLAKQAAGEEGKANSSSQEEVVPADRGDSNDDDDDGTISTFPPIVEPPAEKPDPSLTMTMCAGGGLIEAKAPLWGIHSNLGTTILRVGAGAGDVTVLPNLQILENRSMLLGDDTAIALATLQLHGGSHVWVVAGNVRAGILEWLWGNAWVAVCLGLLAIVLWLLRATRRFGPLVASAPSGRRALSEQIIGTGMYLWRRSPAALKAAQLRALEELARARIIGYERLDRADRVAAIVRATGVGEASLLRAFTPDSDSDWRTLPARIASLEAARRALKKRPIRALSQQELERKGS